MRTVAAAARLDVSLSTIDRMILRGDLSIEKEPHGSRHKVWVLLDDDASDKSPVGGTEGSSDLSGEISDTVELRILRERVRSLEELAAYHREQLKESELRFQQLTRTKLIGRSRESRDPVPMVSLAEFHRAPSMAICRG